MFKKSLLIMLLMALFTPLAMFAQQTVEIGDGTATSNAVPIGTWYNYSITEQLYTAEEIGAAGTISSISFYYMGVAENEIPITVYMNNVDAADLTSGISLADAEVVFDGTLPVTTTAGWVTIDLDSPFAYDGTSNLLIGVIKGYLQYFSGQTWQCTATDVTMARYTQNDGSSYTTSTVPGSTSANRPNIQIVITPSGGTICEKPETMEASNVTTNSATLTWTGGSGHYNVEYKKASDEEWTSKLTNSTATTTNLTDLAPGTAYQARVQSVCSDGTSGWKSVSFSTMFGIPLVEEFGTAIPTGWAQYTGLMGGVLADTVNLTATSYGWSFGTNNGVFDDHARANIYGTSCQRWLVLPTVLMENNVQLMFEVAYTAYSGTGAPAQNGDDDKFVVLIHTDQGWSILREWNNAGSQYVLNDLNTTPATMAFDLSSYAGKQVAVAFYAESTVSNADNNIHIDNVSIDYIPACPKPTGLAVNYENGTTATVTWDGSANGFDLDVNGTVISGVTSPYTLSNLDLATLYEVMVRANCGDEVSEWTNPVSFTTDYCLPENMCQLTFVVTDSYGDGWNGAAILVLDYEMYTETGDIDASLLAAIANTNTAAAGEAQTYTLDVCDGRDLIFGWQSGSYDSETSYQIIDNVGDVLEEGSAGFDAFAYTVACNSTCRKPTDFAASEIGPRSAVLSWTENGEATSWVIAYMAATDTVVSYVDASTNPFTLTDLTPETTYYAIVRSDCGEVEKWSDQISFKTTEACPKPTLDVTAYPFSAMIDWTAFSDSYDLEWALVPGDDVTGKDGLWLQYDDGTVTNNIGNSTVYEWSWGVMYPADMLNGNGQLSKVAYYETSYYTAGETITINVYSGGDTAPESLVYSEDVTCEALGAIREITLAETVLFDPTQNLWITLTSTTLTYPMAMCAVDEANGRWVDNGGEWIDLGTALSSVSTCSFLIRGYVESTFDPTALDWNPELGILPPYELTDLEPETTYAVRVKANCGEDGESSWAMVTFTTPSACDTPINLNVDEVTATSATLSWLGYQNSYDVRYRHPVEADPSTPATIIFEAHDVWGDGSGYQMLFDADANTYGTLWNANHYIFVDGEQYTGGDLPTTYYDEFEYKIPEGANGALSDTINVVIDDIVTFTIPAGTYDYVILNPTPGDRFYIAADNGQVPCAGDDFEFKPGVTYHFTMQRFGSGDGAAFELIQEWGDWITVSTAENSAILSDLTPNTDYEWQVQGKDKKCDGGATEWTEVLTFTTPELTTYTQTIALLAGTNYFSTNVEITLDDLKAALVEALADDENIAITISAKSQNTKYTNGRWRGNLTFDLTHMFMIEVSSDCEITLEGMLVDPATPINIVNGANWIAYPLTVTMTQAEALAGFEVVNGDVIAGKNGNARYTGGRWRGTVNLEPGQGYIYTSAADYERPLVFTNPSKAAPKAVTTVSNDVCKKTVKAENKNLDLMPAKVKTDAQPAKVKTINLRELVRKANLK